MIDETDLITVYRDGRPRSRLSGAVGGRAEGACRRREVLLCPPPGHQPRGRHQRNVREENRRESLQHRQGPGGHHGSKLRADLAKQGKKLPILGAGDDRTADRNYIKEFLLAGNRELGRKYGVEYAKPSTTSVRQNRVSMTTSSRIRCR